MNKLHFIESFRTALSEKVPSTVIEDNVRFYEDYIETQIQLGKSEEEVLSGLGDPRLLAKTIIEANKHAEGSSEYEYREQDAYEYGQETTKKSSSLIEWYIGLPHWLRMIINILLTIVVVTLVASIVSFLFWPVCIFILITSIVRMYKSR